MRQWIRYPFSQGRMAVMGVSLGKRMGPMAYAALLAMLSLAGGCAKTQEPRGDDGERELELARAQNTALHQRLKHIAAYEAEVERGELAALQASELAASELAWSEWSAEPEALSLCERQGHGARPVVGDSMVFANLSVGGFPEAYQSLAAQPDRPKWRLEWGCARDELSLALDLLRKDWKRENARLAFGDFASGLRWQDMDAQADPMSLVVRLNRQR
jgi:hypothetical protein